MDTNSQRGFIANLQSFRTMVPGGPAYSKSPTRNKCCSGPQFSIANPQQVLPLAKDPMLSATWKVAITQLLICLPDSPAVWQV